MTRIELAVAWALVLVAIGGRAQAKKPEGEHQPREIISDGDAPWSAGTKAAERVFVDPAAPEPISESRARPLSSSSNDVVVAVFDVQDPAGQLSERVVDQLTEYLATRVTEALAFRVVPREQVRARLLEQKAASFRPCFHESCQIELGKALAAKKALSTKLLRLGRTCALTSTLYDLKTETAEAAASAKSSCGESDLLAALDRVAIGLRR
jgi:hypothetical protein